MFMENYFESQKDHIFRNVQVLIYVLGSPGANQRDTELQKDMSYFKSTMESIKALSPHANCFCLIHKMDLIHESQRQQVFEDYKSQIQQLAGVEIACFPTSIWDETLFKAWSQIVYSLIPNVHILEQQLAHF